MVIVLNRGMLIDGCLWTMLTGFLGLYCKNGTSAYTKARSAIRIRVKLDIKPIQHKSARIPM